MLLPTELFNPDVADAAPDVPIPTGYDKGHVLVCKALQGGASVPCADRPFRSCLT